MDAAGTLLDLRPTLAERAATVARGWGARVDLHAAEHAIATRPDWPPDSDDYVTRQHRWTLFCDRLLTWLAPDNECPAPSREERLRAARLLADQALDPRNYALYPDTEACLHDLAAAQTPAGIVSNFDTWLLDILRTLQIADRFKCVVLSSVEGVTKPDPRIFAAGASCLGLLPREILFVGDSPAADVEGAEACGMQGVLLDRANRFTHSRHTRIRSLARVRDFL